jgi:hypothetical protein
LNGLVRRWSSTGIYIQSPRTLRNSTECVKTQLYPRLMDSLLSYKRYISLVWYHRYPLISPEWKKGTSMFFLPIGTSLAFFSFSFSQGMISIWRHHCLFCLLRTLKSLHILYATITGHFIYIFPLQFNIHALSCSVEFKTFLWQFRKITYFTHCPVCFKSHSYNWINFFSQHPDMGSLYSERQHGLLL